MGVSLKSRTIIALWKANVPHWVWIGSPAWIGAILLGIDRRTSEWETLILFIVAMLTIQSSAEFANSYTDRDEDRIYGPTNTLVTGELDIGMAKKVLILQNIVSALLVIALLVITTNFALIVTMIVGWFFGLAYSVRPFRFKLRTRFVSFALFARSLSCRVQ